MANDEPQTLLSQTGPLAPAPSLKSTSTSQSKFRGRALKWRCTERALNDNMPMLHQIFGALPHEPPPRFTRPVTSQGVRDSTYRPGTTNQDGYTYPVPKPPQGYIVSHGCLGKRNTFHPSPAVVVEARARAASASAARRVQHSRSNVPRSSGHQHELFPTIAQRGGPTARPQALGQVRASQPHPHGFLTIGPASASRPMSSSSRASNASNISAQAKAAQDILARITPRMKADPEMRAALRKIKTRAKDLEA